MQPDRWKHLQDIYFRALEMPSVRRSLFLDTTCRHDPAMRQEVESLLQCEDKIGQFLEVIPPEIFPAIEDLDSTGDSPNDDFIGTVIDDRYVVTRRVGSGGMGIVYRADHRLLGRPVAIKRLAEEFRDREEFRKQAVDEARRAVQLDHENVAKVKDVVEESNEVFVVMEFIDGQTLKSRLDRPISRDEFLDIATECASGLEAAHQKRIAHLDLKPANIMLTESGHVKICDFGVARQLPSPEDKDVEEARWTFGGTPAYMAPEVLEGNQFDVRADIFSLGVVFYELLSRTHPFRSEDVRSTTNRILKETPPPLRETRKKLPARLTRLIERMLAKEPRNRPTATETLEELRMIQFRSRLLREAWKAPGKVIPMARKKPAATFSILVTILMIVAGWVRFGPVLAFNRPTDPKSVAVLPFHTNRLDRESFARGVSSMLTYRLMDISAVPGLQIASAGSINDLNIDTVDKARVELGASIVVRGSFDFSGNQTTFNYSLVRAADNQLLRSDRVRTNNSEDPAFVDDIIKEISSQLEIKLRPPAAPGTKNAMAFSLYRDGMGLLSEYHLPENLQAAIRHFTQALALDTHFAAAYAALGEAYWYQFQEKNGDRSLLDQSFAACQTADELLQGGQTEPQVCLGRVYQTKGDYETATDYYRRAIQLSAANDKAFQLLGLALEDQHLFDEAEKEYLRAIKLRPDDWAPHSWIAGFYNISRQDYAKALDHYKLALSKSKDNARVHYSIASAYVNLGQYEDAVKSLQRSASLRPWAPRPASNLGLAYLMWRHYDDALRELDNAFQLENADDLDTNYRITGNLARIYELRHQPANAHKMYDLAIEQGLKKLGVNPRDHRVHILLGRYYAAVGKRTDAKKYLELALKARPDDPHYLLIAATAYVALHEPANALSCMEQAINHGYAKVQIDAEPELDALKEEPKYKQLISSLQPPK